MRTIREEARDVPVAAECDVCVIGGGCTGVFAAVAAARLGARVALVENNGFFGGVATAGLVNVWHSLHDTQGEARIIAGLTQEVIERLERRGGVVFGAPAGKGPYTVLGTEDLKIVLDELVQEAGVRPFLHCRFAAAHMEGGRIGAAVVEDKSGRRAIAARYFVDASGDGDLIARAGLPFTGRDDLQPPTTCALLQGLGEIETRNPDFRLAAAAFEGSAGEGLPRGYLWSTAVPGARDLRLVAGTRVSGADCSDADQLTRAELEGRRQVRLLRDRLREGFEGGESVALVGMSSYIGIRETRHARCRHTLTEQEVLTGERFADAIANGTYPCDVHHSGKPGITLRYLDGREDYAVPGRPTERRRWRPEQEASPMFWQIPYRSLVPEGAENVLVAGRLVDADRGAYGAVRVMVACNQTGEAAGTACRLALQDGGSVAEVEAGALRETMARQGSAIV